MWIQATALLLLACCPWPAEAQRERRQSIWEDPIKFQTKTKDKCTMLVTGQGEYIKLRLSCQGSRRSYWCEYVGKPYTCPAFNKNPRHYFVQMMWRLRKLPNACQGPRELKPHMCRKATDESLMIFSAGPFLRSRPPAQPSKQPERSQGSLGHTRPNLTVNAPFKAVLASGRVKTTQRANSQPTAPSTESTRKRMARQYCWRSLQGVCSFVIGLFRN